MEGRQVRAAVYKAGGRRLVASINAGGSPSGRALGRSGNFAAIGRSAGCRSATPIVQLGTLVKMLLGLCQLPMHRLL